MKHAAKVTLAYLALTLPLAARSALLPTTGSAGAGVLLAHLGAIAALAWSWRRGRGFLADWMPLLLVAILYGELPYLIHGLHGATVSYHDAAVQRWELALFGWQPSHELAGRFPYTWLSEIVHAGYASYYALIFGPPLLLYLRGKRDAFAATSAALMSTFVACYLVFIVFPVEGPRYAWPAPPGIPHAPVRDAVLWLLGNGSSRGTAFPSSHAAVATAATIATLRYQRPVGFVAVALTLLLVVGAVYGGFHYAIDMLVGVPVGIVVGGAVLWGMERMRNGT